MSQPQLKQSVSMALAHRESTIEPLEALVAELPQAGRHEIGALIQMLREGHSAEEWLKHPRAAAWIPVIAGEEHSADSSRRLARLLHSADLESQRRSNQWTAMLYPLIVLGLAMAVFIGLSILIVPEFATIYDDFQLSLPGPTSLVIWASKQFTEFLLRTIIVVLAMVGLAIFLGGWIVQRGVLARWPRGRLEGGSTNLRAMASATGSIAELLSIGASLPEALTLAAHACNHQFLARSLDQLAVAAKDGSQQVQHASAARWFPANAIDAMARAEHPSAIPTLRMLSQLYLDRADCRIDWFRYLLGPMALLAVGAVVGFVAFSLFMPLIRLVSGLSVVSVL